MRKSLIILAMGVLAVGRAAVGAEGETKEVAAFLDQYCLNCHDADVAKGGVTLPTGLEDKALRSDAPMWRTVLDQLREQAMPPAGKKQPTEGERQQAINWLREALLRIEPNVRDPGHVTLRRLNRAEYNNTIRDLLGVDTRPADAFPADGAGGGGFDNNADTLFIPAVLIERYLAAATELIEKTDPNRLFVVKPAANVPDLVAARHAIGHFATRAFRRPVAEEEIGRYLKLYLAAAERGDGFEPAVKLALKALLVSPQFLFRIEAKQPSPEPYRVGDYEMASRLSYFLWSSMPDEELFQLAAQGKLQDPAVLEQQARRMLADPKSKALADSFATQWLGIRLLQTLITPASRDYTPALRDAMIGEAVLFVDSVFRDDASVMTLIDADYTFVNADLAKLYGISGIDGPELRRVALNDPNRGGVLGLAGVLTVTSYPRRTSPVLRGRWVLDDLLGVPPPPPPPDVPALKDDAKSPDGTKLSLRQRVEKHRKDPNCASCHARMDPIGFGLENFDSIGRWRDTDEGQPVDAAGRLVSGEAFKGPAELKRILAASKREQFVRNLTEKLLAYAIGRGVEYYDERTIVGIMESLAKSDDRAGTLVTEIVKSYPFRYRRGDDTAAAGEKASASQQ